MTTELLTPEASRFAPGHTAAPPGPSWAAEARDALIDRLNELLALPPDWDTYGAHAIDPAAVQMAQRIVEQALTQPLPLPTVRPLPNGGVQLEWSARPVEIELEVEPGGTGVVFVCDDDQADQQIDGALPGDVGLFRNALARLSAYA